MRTLILLAMATLAEAQSLTEIQGRLRAARAANSEAAYLEVERRIEGDGAAALLYRGAVKMERAGWYAQHQRFGPANAVMAEACAEMDRAVALEPRNVEWRRIRGSIYARLPRFYNKADGAREDLEFALARDPSNAELRALLKQLGDSKPDRFPKVAADASPIIVAATVTDPKGGSVQWIVDAMKGQAGLLATHVLKSVDKPGMTVILTWWQDKAAVNNWFYGDTHQGMIRSAYGGGRSDVSVTQVGIELFAPLEGGTQIGGGLTPKR